MKDKAAREEKIAAMREVGKRIAALESDLRQVEAAFREKLLWLPNIPHESTPVGVDERDNVVVRTWGERRDFTAEGFEPAPHWDLGPELDILDFERGVRLAGSRSTSSRGRALGATRPHLLDAGSAHARARLHGDLPALRRPP